MVFLKGQSPREKGKLHCTSHFSGRTQRTRQSVVSKISDGVKKRPSQTSFYVVPCVTEV